MPRVIQADASDSIELGDLIEKLETDPFDPRDEDCFASFGATLKQLANNQRFLGDIVIAELKQQAMNQVNENQFTPQVILLYGRGRDFIIRANFWPAAHDSIVVNSGTSPFFYGLPHDHNFSFLTVGYMGPGYWSEYYEYDYENAIGYAGEPIDLRFIEKTKLDQGKVMLYRAHRDVHNQLPADEMSISINIVEATHGVSFRDQYRFDVENKRIHSEISVLPLEQMLALAAHVGGDNGIDLLEGVAAGHPSARVRFHALKARASALTTLDERIALFANATRQDNPYVSQMAKVQVEKLELSRGWIEGEPLQPAA